MNKFSTKKRSYIKPSVQMEVIDYAISVMTPTGNPEFAIKNPNPNPTPKPKGNSPFGGSKPVYK